MEKLCFPPVAYIFVDLMISGVRGAQNSSKLMSTGAGMTRVIACFGEENMNEREEPFVSRYVVCHGEVFLFQETCVVKRRSSEKAEEGVRWNMALQVLS